MRGAEAVVHTLRQWVARHKSDAQMILLKRDYENAFNMADEHELLRAAFEHLPGSARLAEWCYGEAVNLVYNGRAFDRQSSRGQQSCPLMGPMFLRDA